MKKSNVIAVIAGKSQYLCFLRNALIAGQMKRSGSGLSTNICRLRLTVGCCENTIAVRIIPASPQLTINEVSKSHKLQCKKRSIARQIAVNDRRMNEHSIGRKGKDVR